MNSSRDAADYIKGFCIALITWHHLIYNNFPKHFSYLGNEFVSFYFIVSGFGIFFSLNKTFQGQMVSGVLDFYKKRFVRIYPMYWIWFAFGYHFKSSRTALYWTLSAFGDIYKINCSYVMDFFLISLDRPPVWFLNAIFYCYLLSPLFFLIVRKFNAWSLAIFAGILLGVNLLCHDMQIPKVLIYAYRDVYFFYLLFFGGGMLLPWLMSKKKEVHNPYIYIVPSFLLFVFFAIQVTHHPISALALPKIPIFGFDLNAYSIPFFLDAMFLTYMLLCYCPKLPLQKAFIVVGKYSLPIYLVNDYFGDTIIKVMGNGYVDAVYFLVFAIFFPLLVLACSWAQKLIYLPFKAKD